MKVRVGLYILLMLDGGQFWSLPHEMCLWPFVWNMLASFPQTMLHMSNVYFSHLNGLLWKLSCIFCEGCFLHIQLASCNNFGIFEFKEWSVGPHISLFICQNPAPHLATRSPTTASRWGFYSNPIPNILLGPPRDKAYWGMLVYPYELNGPQLYQDHPAGQGCSVRGYDVAKLTRHKHAHMLRRAWCTLAHAGSHLVQPWLMTRHLHCRFFMDSSFNPTFKQFTTKL